MAQGSAAAGAPTSRHFTALGQVLARSRAGLGPNGGRLDFLCAALARSEPLQAIARARGCTPAQVALAWVLRQPDAIAIPKAVQSAHLRDNLAAASMALSAAELAHIDAAFPPPRRKQALAMS